MLAAVAALCLTLGALLLALRWLGRLHGVTPGGGRTGALEVLDRTATGPRQGIALVRVADRVLIVGVGEDHVLLGELDGAARADLLQRATPRGGGTTPGSLLGRFGLALVLLAAPLGDAAAQVITAPAPAAGAPTAVTSPIAPTVTPPAAPTVDLRVSGGGESVELSGAVGIVVLMGVLTLLPAIVLLMTGFTRILIVLGFLRTAIGTQGAPPTQLLVAVALLLTGLVMRPVMAEVNATALQPYLQGEMGQAEAYRAALVPLRGFMLANTRDQDLRTFAELGGEADATNLDELGTMTVLSAFVTSELRTAFQMGFLLFLPFLVIDLIVASVLMSMGMFMLPPIMVSLPFKLLLFVLADGWSLVMQGLVASFRAAA
jgi:flagellar biosynthetic protein FliP